MLNPRWLGLVVAPPQIGAPLVIGRPDAPRFLITSPVRFMFARDDGTLVHTDNRRNYLVGIAGNTYIVLHTV